MNAFQGKAVISLLEIFLHTLNKKTAQKVCTLFKTRLQIHILLITREQVEKLQKFQRF